MLKDKVIVITGAGSGLGRAMSVLFAQKGAKLILVGRGLDKLERTAEMVRDIEGYADIFAADITVYEEVKRLFKFVKAEYYRVDILINNAGVGSFGKLEDLSLEEIDKMIDTNLKGTIFCTQKALSLMKLEDQGQIVNIISTAGKRGKAEESVYSASKFGVSGLTKSLQQELKESKIKITGVYVGGMETPFWEGVRDDISAFMSSDNVAEAILELVDKPKNMNVSEVVIDRN
ncbi:SDR family oxidoreductase [Orenia marismortui]|uniref:Short-subunit dehydrogenase n=1 Tax=Orenia marismortui TaxID=46469 RepID=A0A4V3H041_9FIRM|nr:SDR family oxidoreductase [Orenia marismortui]TDX59299.1 short-subunit dehydrogenase [Orenia marismortui]